MKKYVVLAVFLAFIVCSCEEIIEPVDLEGLHSLSIRPNQDTIFLSSDSAPFDLSLKGSFIEEYENITSMSGLTETSTFIFVSYDTLTRDIPASQVAWFSSHPDVAEVSAEGIVYARAEGVARIYAEANDVASNSLFVRVAEPLYAPSLALDRPLNQIVFSSLGNVSGYVQDGAVLFIDNSELPYTREGRFSHTVANLSPGINPVEVRAVSANDNSLFSSQVKTFYYYPLGYDPDAPENSVVGPWDGIIETVLPFNFEIVENESLSGFEISGTLSIDFIGVFYVENVYLEGIINEDGHIEASLTKTGNGYNVGGVFSGLFSTLGTAEGEFTAEYIKEGFPKIDFTGQWKAVRK